MTRTITLSRKPVQNGGVTGQRLAHSSLDEFIRPHRGDGSNRWGAAAFLA